MALNTGAMVLALVEKATSAGAMDWHAVANGIEDVGSADRLYAGDWTGFESESARELHRFAQIVSAADLERFEMLIDMQESQGVRLITILDDDYPSNLREIFNRPPFLFVKGELTEVDRRAVAVVGTRAASPEGLLAARSLAGDLARNGVTVLSGLASGIDTAAHTGALDAGGRTVAVMGTGIDAVYPAANRDLAERITQRGALVSQFWPGHPPTSYSFPLRNVVMSGMGVGTIVIEASATSGAKMQARLALEHGKRVFLLESLVTSQEWARRYAERPGAEVVRRISDILDVLVSLAQPPADQLTLG